MWESLKSLLGFGKSSATTASPGVKDMGDALVLTVVCGRCGEEIEARLRKSSDIQRNFDGGDAAFYVQKTLVGKRCFNRVEVRLEMDEKYRLIDAATQGGSLLSERG